MVSFILVSDDPDRLNGLARGLKKIDGVRVEPCFTGQSALERIGAGNTKVDLVVVDETVGDTSGLNWVEKIVDTNPMVNTALVSSLEDKDFQDYTEGLGVLMRISPEPDETEADEIYKKLSKVLSLYKTIGS